MTFDIITIFPKIFNSYFSESIVSRAQRKKLIKINIYNLRDFTKDRHKTVDDRPYGGGAGMVMKVEPIFKAVKKIKSRNSRFHRGSSTKSGKNKKLKVILFSAKGKKFDQKIAKKFSKLDGLILICGRYEGVDERVAKYIADTEISIGDYVLTGGEIPAMIMVDTITRLIPNAIKKESLREESFKNQNLEYPQYTRPPKFYPKEKFRRAGPEIWKVPNVLLSGHHKKIREWRDKHSKIIEK